MNPFEMVIGIILIVTIGKVLMHRNRYRASVMDDGQAHGRESIESARLRDEVQKLKERIHVLERIAVDKEDTLSREIERLRDR